MTFYTLLACIVLIGVKTADAVRCMQCVDMPHPFECNVVTECSSVELCYVEQFITSSGITLYNTGCLSKQRCSASKRDLKSYLAKRDAEDKSKRQQDLVSKTDLVTCLECCQGDNCNIEGCYEAAVPRANRGPKCYDCKAEDAPELCRDTLNCDYDQVCAILHEHPYDREWSSKCMGKIQCHALVQFQSQHAGKRATVNVKDCPRCCEEDFCNDQCGHNVTYIPTTHATPPPTTPKPTTHAPTTHAPTTHAPTTQKPTTHKPTTHAPTTHAPTTHKPTTHKPITQAHTTPKPEPVRTTLKPTTHAPTTHKPTTHAPTTPKPTTPKPTTHAPTTHAPTTPKPTTPKPTTPKPTTAAPTVPTTTPHLVTTPDPKINCEADGYIFDRPTRMCLKFFMDKKNWTNAQAACMRDNGRLVVMTSDAKTHDVKHYLNTLHKYADIDFWVGATEISHVHTFTWTDGKTLVVDDFEKYDLTKTNCLLTANPEPPIVYAPCPTAKSYICENSNYIRA